VTTTGNHVCLACGRPQLLDTFSGRGGAGVGYQRAGYCVSAVDNNPAHLMAYPIDCEGAQRFMGDAIEGILTWGSDFAAIHASPTCTGYSRGTAAIVDRLDRYDRLIGATRAALLEVGVPYVIENVADARPELINPAMLCGRMFGLTATDTDGVKLTLDRHRLFETNWAYVPPAHTAHGWKTNQLDGVQVAGAYGGARRDKVEAREIRKGGYVPADLGVLQALLDIDWMDDEKAIFLAIPPAYSEHIGRQLLTHICQEVAA
jgi:DNA (cytosine-5)-methyltransferase 1